MANTITRTIKSSIVTVIGINPCDYDKVETKVTILGNYSEMTDKEKEKVKSNLISDTFVPALVIDKGEYSEDVYEITIEDFIKYGHKVEKQG